MADISKFPFIKWTGSKRKQAPYIVDQFPKNINTYYEPFLGGGSVLHELLNRIYEGEYTVKKIVCSDINKDLIDIFNIFKNKDTRKKLYDYYTKLHNELLRRADVPNTPDIKDQVKKCQTLYYEMRDKYNKMDKDNPERPYIFYWITRTSFNGLIRYNPKTGYFNSPFHVAGRFGIRPEELEKVFDTWGNVIDNVDIEFVCKPYNEVIKDATKGDLIYMDPPYEKSGGMYFCNGFDTNLFWNILMTMNMREVNWLLSYDGFSGEENNTANVPKDLYKRHEYVNSGHSSFKKLKSKSCGTENAAVVKDSLYLNYEKNE